MGPGSGVADVVNGGVGAFAENEEDGVCACLCWF